MVGASHFAPACAGCSGLLRRPRPACRDPGPIRAVGTDLRTGGGRRGWCAATPVPDAERDRRRGLVGGGAECGGPARRDAAGGPARGVVGAGAGRTERVTAGGRGRATPSV